ncbi:MAG TPA: glycosyltransferase family 4 protein [Polyangiaceae bacterium]|nr:glycosyltransferase family 4 protein [Polyangiaceae bacterium]
MSPRERLRVAFVASHPVPYHVPTYRVLARRSDLDFEVLYTHDHGVHETFDVGFGRAVKFDVPLLTGYRHRFPKNLARRPSLRFTGQVNPELPVDVMLGAYDAVILHGYQCVTTVAALLAPRAHRTHVLLRGESTLLDRRSPGKRLAKQIVLRPFFARVDHFLAIGTLSREFFQAHGVPAQRITIAPYTVDNAYFEAKSADARANPRAARQRLGLPQEGPIFLYCSKIIPHKRPLDVLRAFARARQRVPAALAYVGDGSQTGELRAEVERLGLGSDVHVLGFRNQSDLPEIYGACDVFIQASDREPWGMVVNEAMACGMAICASDRVGSARDLVVDNGAVFPMGDVARLAELIEGWARRPDEVARMKRASERRIRGWGPEQTADGILAGIRAARAARPG